MGRSKTSAADAAVQLVAKLPWWGALALGFAGWLVFHRLSAVQPDTTAFAQGKAGIPVASMMVAALGLVLQFVFPALCAIAALVSWMGRHKRAGLVHSVTHSTSADTLNGMSWREFEMLVGEAFRIQGYAVTESGGSHLLGLIQRARVSLAGAKESAAPRATVDETLKPQLGTTSCPVCDGAMVRRTARQGASAGSEFWGCSSFPKCRGTRKA